MQIAEFQALSAREQPRAASGQRLCPAEPVADRGSFAGVAIQPRSESRRSLGRIAAVAGRRWSGSFRVQCAGAAPARGGQGRPSV